METASLDVASDDASERPAASSSAAPPGPHWMESVLPRSLWVAYGLGAALCVLVVWVPRYPAGIDLPQHAVLFQVLANYWDPGTGYRHFYSTDFFTPYALLYLAAWPLAKVGGALFATKVLLTLAALATPLSIARWLRSVGGEPMLCLLGFLTAFAYAYQWGFFSMMLAAPVATAYLAAAAELRAAPGVRRVVIAAGLGIALFFSHGIVFAVTMLASGLIVLAQRNLRRMVVELIHFVPILAVLVPWYLSHREEGAAGVEDLAGSERVATAFWGLFYPFESHLATLGGLAVAALLVVFGRPVLARSFQRTIPFAVALLGLLALPDSIFDTAFVGSRFVNLVWLFAPAALELSIPPAGVRTVRRLLAAAVLAGLGTQLYRLHVFNREIAPLDVLRAHIPPGADLKLHPERQESKVAGRLGQTPAWISAAQGGVLENSGSYFQLPVRQRGSIAWPEEYEFHVARGTVAQARRTVGKKATLVESEGDFHLFRQERVSLSAPGLTLVRWGQSWGKPHQDRSVEDAPLVVGGKEYATGFGAHARSILQMRLAAGVRRVRGLVGMDDGAPDTTRAVFKVMDARRKVLWKSDAVRTGDAAAPFEVEVTGLEGDLFLLTEPAGGGPVDNAHTDWLEVEGR